MNRHAGKTVAPFVERLARRFDHCRMIRKAEIVVGAQNQNWFSTDLYLGALRRSVDVRSFLKRPASSIPSIFSLRYAPTLPYIINNPSH